jgi:hypothetical protein
MQRRGPAATKRHQAAQAADTGLSDEIRGELNWPRPDRGCCARFRGRSVRGHGGSGAAMVGGQPNKAGDAQHKERGFDNQAHRTKGVPPVTDVGAIAGESDASRQNIGDSGSGGNTESKDPGGRVLAGEQQRRNRRNEFDRIVADGNPLRRDISEETALILDVNNSDNKTQRCRE